MHTEQPLQSPACPGPKAAGREAEQDRASITSPSQNEHSVVDAVEAEAVQGLRHKENQIADRDKLMDIQEHWLLSGKGV